MIEFDLVAWDDFPGGNVEHIAEHGLDPEDVEHVLRAASGFEDISRSSGRPEVFGYTADGRFILVVYELEHDEGFTVLIPITAYEVPEPF